MVQAILPALFGAVALAVASQAVRRGYVRFRGMQFVRSSGPAAFLSVVSIYLVMGLLSLGGAAWIWLLSSIEP